jgi:hypothetical protein
VIHTICQCKPSNEEIGRRHKRKDIKGTQRSKAYKDGQKRLDKTGYKDIGIRGYWDTRMKGYLAEAQKDRHKGHRSKHGSSK